MATHSRKMIPTDLARALATNENGALGTDPSGGLVEPGETSMQFQMDYTGGKKAASLANQCRMVFHRGVFFENLADFACQNLQRKWLLEELGGDVNIATPVHSLLRVAGNK